MTEFHTSVGFPIIPANPPATPAQAIVDPVESLPPFLRCKLRARRSYSAKRAVEYVVWRSIEADRPDQSDRIPAKSEGRTRNPRLSLPSRTANVCSAFNIGCLEDTTCIQLQLVSHFYFCYLCRFPSKDELTTWSDQEGELSKVKLVDEPPRCINSTH
jgi:hypothetical protein